ncbi:MAG: hypothetical protein LH609_23175 [Rudanella sp.]|nr:hypothetical protein [Rudanella sp.]
MAKIYQIAYNEVSKVFMVVDNSVRYTNLPPGSYRFEVVAADNEGRWTPAPGFSPF